MELTQAMKQYILNHQPELRQLIRDLCAIPAPSHHEEQRAAFCKRWLEEAGGKNVTIDGAKNVLCPWGVTDDKPVVVVMAHMDTVFPDREPLPFREDAERFYCPGVCDDTAQLAVLMLVARYLMQCCPVPERVGVLFVANSCEEGLGDLKGSRQIVRDYGARMRELITVDSTRLHFLCNHAVGSHRYEITVRTEGGHSFGAFGNRNAIACLASMIDTLYDVKVPQEGDSRTTYNVGVISGGTSVNTIAQEATMLYEYRSDSRVCLENMQAMLQAVIEAYRAMGLTVEVRKIGDRPCGGDVDPAAEKALADRAAGAIRRQIGEEPVFRSGSTDCNIPLSLGIPAIAIGGCIGQGVHTREEYLELSSLEPGCRYVMDFLLQTLYG